LTMITGPIYWPKILGEPQPGYDKRIREWSFDFGVDKKTEKQLNDLGVGDYIKTKDGHVSKGPFMKFTRREKRADGTDATPISVVGPDGKPWPQDKRIGNGSICNVKIALNEKATGGLKPSVIALQVWEYVPYEGGDAFPTREAGGEEAW